MVHKQTLIQFSSIVKKRVSKRAIPGINLFIEERKKKRTLLDFKRIETCIYFLFLIIGT